MARPASSRWRTVPIRPFRRMTSLRCWHWGKRAPRRQRAAAARLRVERQGPPRSERNVWYRYKNQKALSVAGKRSFWSAIRAIEDLAVARPAAATFVPDRHVVPGAVASDPGSVRSRAVPTVQSRDSAVSIPPVNPWRLWRRLRGWQPEFHGQLWASQQRTFDPAENHRTGAAP